jgi:DTW domain-containing protein YfiP
MENLNFEFSHTRESRAFCPDCDFLKSRCLCESLKVIPNTTHLIILQHPSESKHPLNTVRIMKKSFKNITIFVGEDFSAHSDLNAILTNPHYSCALIYPSETSTELEKISSDQKPTHLILLDGTWRKAKKVFLLSKNLQTLPAYTFKTEIQSDYRIRQSSIENSLSTLEASSLALKTLEPTLDTASALETFKTMIDFQIKKMGRDLYQKNYLDKKIKKLNEF